VYGAPVGLRAARVRNPTRSESDPTLGRATGKTANPNAISLGTTESIRHQASGSPPQLACTVWILLVGDILVNSGWKTGCIQKSVMIWTVVEAANCRVPRQVRAVPPLVPPHSPGRTVGRFGYSAATAPNLTTMRRSPPWAVLIHPSHAFRRVPTPIRGRWPG